MCEQQSSPHYFFGSCWWFAVCVWLLFECNLISSDECIHLQCGIISEISSRDYLQISSVWRLVQKPPNKFLQNFILSRDRTEKVQMIEHKKITLHLPCILCVCRVVFLHSFISSLFLYWMVLCAIVQLKVACVFLSLWIIHYTL